MNYHDPENVPPVWQLGDVILDRYEVKQVFTGGGMGLVYRVHHRDWAMDLAVKSPRPEFFQTQQHIENFEREAETWVNLGLHPHIVSCYYVRRLGGIPRIFAEFVEGGTLADWIRTKKLYDGDKEKALERVIDVAIQFAWGLQYAHDKGLVHQDVKPGNVLLSPDGTAKVSDFGLANARRASAESTVVAGRAGQSILVPGSGFMTPEYASPEQLRVEHLSRKTDVWSWAVSLFEMLLGELTWASGLAVPSAIEDLDEGRIDEELITLLNSCFGSRSRSRWGSFDPVLEALSSYYTSRFGTYYRSAPQSVELLADSLNNRGASLLDLGRHEEGVVALDKALRIDHTHPEAVYNRGMFRWHTAAATDADIVAQLKQVELSRPGDWKPSYYLGIVQLERQDIKAATLALEKAAAYTDSAEIIATLNQARRIAETNVGNPVKRITTGRGNKALCISRDGRWAIQLGKYDREFQLVDTATDTFMRSFRGHTSTVTAICLSEDNRNVLSGCWDTTLCLWDVNSGQCLRTFVGHPDSITCVKLSLNGKWAVSGSYDGTACLWDVSSGRKLHTFGDHIEGVSAVCFIPGNGLLTQGGDGTVQLWDVITGRHLRTYKYNQCSIEHGCLSRDNRRLLSTAGSLFRLCDIMSGECLRAFTGHYGTVESVYLSSDNHWAVSGSSDKSVRLWDIATGRCLRTFEGHAGSVISVWLSPDNRWIRSASKGAEHWDDTFRQRLERDWRERGEEHLWDISALTATSVQQRFTFALCRAATIHATIDNQTRFHQQVAIGEAALAVQKWDEAMKGARAARAIPGHEINATALRIWNRAGLHNSRRSLRAGWSLRTFEGHGDCVTSVCLSCDNRLGLTGSGYYGMWEGEGWESDDRTLRLWDIASGSCLRTFEGHTEGINSVCLSLDNRWALSGSKDHTLKLWDVNTGECVHCFDDQMSQVTFVQLSSDNRLALSRSGDGVVRLWDVTTGYSLRVIRGVVSACLSWDARWIICGSVDGSITLWDVACFDSIWTSDGNWGSVSMVCIGVDCKLAISGSEDHVLRLWDLTNGQCLRVFEGHSQGINSVSLSMDNRWAVSGSDDGTVRVWDVNTGQCLRVFEGHMDKVRSVCLSHDSRWILSGGADRSARLWELDWEFEERKPVDWDEGARSHLANFLTLNTPYAIQLPKDREPTDEEIALALTRCGKPSWDEDDFQKFLYTLACAGYGWLRPEGVQRELESMANQHQIA